MMPTYPPDGAPGLDAAQMIALALGTADAADATSADATLVAED